MAAGGSPPAPSVFCAACALVGLVTLLVMERGNSFHDYVEVVWQGVGVGDSDGESTVARGVTTAGVGWGKVAVQHRRERIDAWFDSRHRDAVAGGPAGGRTVWQVGKHDVAPEHGYDDSVTLAAPLDVSRDATYSCLGFAWDDREAPRQWWDERSRKLRTSPGRIRTVVVPLWPLVLGCAGPPFAYLRDKLIWLRLRRRARRGLCTNCGYDLTANVTGVCPECGESVTRWSTLRQDRRS